MRESERMFEFSAGEYLSDMYHHASAISGHDGPDDAQVNADYGVDEIRDASTQLRRDQTRSDIDRDMERPSGIGTISDRSSCETVNVIEEVYLEPGEARLTLSSCHTPRWAMGLARGSRWRFELKISGALEPETHRWSRLIHTTPSPGDDPPVMSSTALALTEVERADDSRGPADTSGSYNLEGQLEFEVLRTGEHTLYMQMPTYDDQLNEGGRIAWHIDEVRPSAHIWSRLTCLSGCDLRATRYPIILIHGYAGVDEYFGVLEYFYRVPDLLRARGYDVHVPSLSPIAWSEDRADQLSRYLDGVQEATGARRFNLIGHSQGGLDSRILISGLGEHERVASLTTIATPHQGIPIELPSFFSIQDFSPEHLSQFNERYPDHPSVRYFSWSARTCALLELSCLRDQDNEIVTPFLLPTYTLLSRFGASDGLIPTESMIYGEHLGELNADHFDQIGQIADRDRGPFAHRAFYLNEAHRLKNTGF